MIIGNDPVILSGTVFLVYYTRATGLLPLPWLMSEFAAANTASMVLFVGNPTNVVICEGFGINNAAFTAYTILPFVACNIFCFVALALQFKDSKYVPRKLNITGQLNVREVLQDPVGAIVGSIILCSCLIVVLVLSFLHIDVWKITLPFAGFKFCFDMAWDHYRYRNGKLSGVATASEEDTVKHAIERVTSTTESSHDQDRGIALVTHVQKSPIGPSSPMITEPSHTRGTLEPQNQSSSSSISHPNSTSETQRACSVLGSPPGASKQRDNSLTRHFPTFCTALPRLPLSLIPFAFSQFILIEALTRHGWIEVFGRWLAIASGGKMFPAIWLVGIMGVILCNIAGTNIGATIFLTKIIHQAGFNVSTERAAAIALAVASNIGAVSFTFSASLAGLLWVTILEQKCVIVKQWEFAKWNWLPLLFMTGAGLAIVSAEAAVLYG